MKKYDVVYADPPWKYDFQESKCRMIENHYPTMKLEDIKNIEITTSNNAVCFIWVTTPKLLEGLEVLDAWGFKYRTCLVWDKLLIGTGYWFRGQHELLLVGVKGKMSPPKPSQRISSVFRKKRTEHSKKPLKIRSLISEWFPNTTKLEMFARERIEGWDCYGNELPKTTQKLLSGIEN